MTLLITPSAKKKKEHDVDARNMPQVLFADGSVSSSRDCGPVWVPEDQVQKETRESTSEGCLNSECTTLACGIVSVCVCVCLCRTEPRVDRGRGWTRRLGHHHSQRSSHSHCGHHTHARPYYASTDVQGHRPHHSGGEAQVPCYCKVNSSGICTQLEYFFVGYFTPFVSNVCLHWKNILFAFVFNRYSFVKDN